MKDISPRSKPASVERPREGYKSILAGKFSDSVDASYVPRVLPPRIVVHEAKPVDAVDDPSPLDNLPPEEIVVDHGKPRQAGATLADTAWTTEYRKRMEGSLFAFCKGILGLSRLSPRLHRNVCRWLQRRPPYRKGLLMPRDHLKTSIVARGLPMHMTVQPKDSNIYLPGKAGCDIRIMLGTETAPLGQKQLRWIENKFLGNHKIKAFWPHLVWDNWRDSPMWNAEAFMLPRTQDVDYPEGTMESIGVGGAVTGRHYDVMIKDDLVTLAAANSATLMHESIEWHYASRALFDDIDTGLEFIIGTRWAVYDLYDESQKNDPSVDWLVRAAIENGQVIWPEHFSLAGLDQLRAELKGLFPLLYLNTAVDAAISDFDMDDVRYYTIDKGQLKFEEDERDVVLAQAQGAVKPEAVAASVTRGMPLNAKTYDIIFGRQEYIRAKRG